MPLRQLALQFAYSLLPIALVYNLTHYYTLRVEQGTLILFGHIVSVYLAHLVALRTFGCARQAALSQWPMLLLMVALTTIGLWILSLPIASGWVGPQ